MTWKLYFRKKVGAGGIAEGSFLKDTLENRDIEIIFQKKNKGSAYL